MYRTAAGYFQEPGPLILAGGPDEYQFPVDAVDVALPGFTIRAVFCADFCVVTWENRLLQSERSPGESIQRVRGDQDSGTAPSGVVHFQQAFPAFGKPGILSQVSQGATLGSTEAVCQVRPEPEGSISGVGME